MAAVISGHWGLRTDTIPQRDGPCAPNIPPTCFWDLLVGKQLSSGNGSSTIEFPPLMAIQNCSSVSPILCSAWALVPLCLSTDYKQTAPPPPPPPHGAIQNGNLFGRSSPLSGSKKKKKQKKKSHLHPPKRQLPSRYSIIGLHCSDPHFHFSIENKKFPFSQLIHSIC